jgi:hypothetical protein
MQIEIGKFKTDTGNRLIKKSLTTYIRKTHGLRVQLKKISLGLCKKRKIIKWLKCYASAEKPSIEVVFRSV